MKKTCQALALAGGIAVPFIARAQYAEAVVSYSSGTGFAAGYTNAGAALGAPALGGSVTPYAPPYGKSQLVSIGAGGEITLQLGSPAVNNLADPYGVNFIVFANEFFVAGGGGLASGLYDHAVTATVQVSADGTDWYTLNPSLAPPPGELYPTYGGGNPLEAVNPALPLTDFEGQNLAGIESLYAGSAGGTGYDLAWVEDGNGDSVDLASADYVRIEVTSGVLDLDGISVVPEPASWTLLAAGAGIFRLGRRLRATAG